MKKNTILIVDDQEVNRFLLREIFEEKYEIIEAANGVEAIQAIKKDAMRICVVLLDVVMPQMDGFEVLDLLREKKLLGIMPVILVTGDTNPELENKGFDKGAVDFVYKPFNPHVVMRRVENIIDLYRHKSNLELLVRKQTNRIEKQAREMQNQLIDMVSAVVEFRDVESGQHIVRIKGFTKILADCVRKTHKEYGLTEEKVAKIVQAAAMHDIGKIAIPDSILLKPGKLTADEFDIMKTHTTKGCGILKSMSFIDDKEFYDYCYDICRYHHEKFDGRGYPEGLSGDNIPIAAQIVSLADAYDALVSERVYKSAYSTDKAYEMIVHGECGMYNPCLIECFTMVKQDFEDLAKKLHDRDEEDED